MTMGIVVDDTVHFLSKYLRARNEQNLSPQDAILYFLLLPPLLLSLDSDEAKPSTLEPVPAS
ncbi:MAG: hypothetical protein JKY88_12540 [Pseudomonadales bacterium]|nr:hypothetical protein [Pseudomonadales bacterium]